MNIRLPFEGSGRVRSARRAAERAFTMIEIAISIGVIGFALVAVIGILPVGLTAQKDNREDTIISQDAPYFLNAIRNGEQRTNNNILTGFVETITTVSNNVDTYTYSNPNLVTTGSNWIPILTNDQNIVGLLSTPQWDTRNQDTAGGLVTNQVTAVIRAMSGSQIGQVGFDAPVAFRYQMTVENVPWTGYSTIVPNEIPPTMNYAYYQSYLNYLTNSLHEVRLRFAWPVQYPSGNVGTGRQTYRTLIASHLGFSNTFDPYLWFFQPQSYTSNLTAH